MNIRQWIDSNILKRLNFTDHCHECGEKLIPLSEDPNQELFTRVYIGGKGHLIKYAFHRKCLVHYFHLESLLEGLGLPN